MEQWKVIKNTNGDYLISNHGNVKSRRIGKGIGEYLYGGDTDVTRATNN